MAVSLQAKNFFGFFTNPFRYILPYKLDKYTDLMDFTTIFGLF